MRWYAHSRFIVRKYGANNGLCMEKRDIAANNVYVPTGISVFSPHYFKEKESTQRDGSGRREWGEKAYE